MPGAPRIVAKVVFLAITTVLGATVGFWGYVYAGAATPRIFPGVHVRDISLGGLSREACHARLEALATELGRLQVEFVHGNTPWRLTLRDIGLKLDTVRMVALAFNAGRKGNFFEQWLCRRKMRVTGWRLPLLVTMDEELLRRRLSALDRSLVVPPRDAGFIVHPDDRVEIVPHAVGQDIAVAQICREIRRSLETGAEDIRIPVYLVPVQPRHTTQTVQAMGITGLLAAYTTSFDPSLVNRAYNISIAAAALDGLLIAPGKEVSFNKIVGPRSQEAGYKDALIIQDDTFIEGIGGGVCQVSSTLYNAVLLANLKVTERANHSLPVAYVPLGRDATVAYGLVDLKFVNTTPSYLYVRAFVRGPYLTIKIYGNTHAKRRVEIKTRTLAVFEPQKRYEKDPNLEAGKQLIKQAGQRGYRVQTERLVWDENGVKREVLPSSLYKPRDEIIAVGTKPVPATITPPSLPPEPVGVPPQEEPLPPAEPPPPPAAEPDGTSIPSGSGIVPSPVP